MNNYKFDNPFKCSKEQNDILSTLSPEQRSAVTQMLKENMYEAIRFLLIDLKDGVSYPTPYDDLNNQINLLIKNLSMYR